jgi:V/A-type H+/Na+-transporting ATPase subunit C
MALKSRLLTAEDYHFLLRARGVDDFSGYLAATDYSSTLAGWDWQGPGAEEEFSRRLYAAMAHAFQRVNKGLKERERRFISILAQRLVAENLKVVLRALHRELSPEKTIPLLIPLGKLSSLAFEELLQQGSVKALVDYLTPTPWGPPLARGLPRYLREQSLFPLEMSLDLWVYESLIQGVKHLTYLDRRIAGQLLGALADITNIIWFGRFKEIYDLPGEEIYQYLLEAGSFRESRRRHDLAFAPDLYTLPSILPKRPYGDLLQGATDLAAVETRLWSFWAQTLGKVLSRPPFQIGLPIAYLFLKELEIHNLITLLTGLILRIPTDRLAPWLQGRAAGGLHV